MLTNLESVAALQHLGKITDTMITMTTAMTKIRFKIRETQDTLPTRLRIEEEVLKSFQDSDPMLTSLLKQAADRIEGLEACVGEMDDIIMRLERRLNEQQYLGSYRPLLNF